MGIVTAQSLVATGLLMYPRFKAGEFGGDFLLGSAAGLPSLEAAPQSDPLGKFWLINTDEGPRALYMVCTHLGCLFKWVDANKRFECPCHGSKFTREGDWIEGPAPRSLDQFVVEVTQDGSVVASTQSADGSIQAPGAPAEGTEIVVKTGSRIQGPAHS
ncbi:MAG: Rieske 2Fe-2S domain-containing protein [Caldilineaceae bacterium]|nr:Rieske 2Fe-2S domain-containing protein [Caldilineaceae bacterium]